MLVRDLPPQGREPWCTCSRGSAPLSRATPLEAARLYLKLAPTRVESLHVPTSRASRATRPSPSYPFETDLPRDGFGGRPCTAGFARYNPDPTPLWGEVPASRPASSRVLGRLPTFRMSPRLGHRATDSLPRAPPAAPPPASPTSRSRRPRRAATRCGPAAQACRAVGGIPQTDLQCPPHGGAVHYQRRQDTTDGVRVPAPVRSRALALSAGVSSPVPFSSEASLLAELGQRGGFRAGARR